MRVVCIKYGTKYGAEYVTRLRNMVARHVQDEHEFVCMTERPVEGVTCEPLPCDLPGWWAKLGYFRQTVGPTLALDLDMVISGPIVLPKLGDKVIALDDFSYSLRKPRRMDDPQLKRLLGGDGTINSSVMYWQGDAGRKVWDNFTPSVMTELHGDQNWITRCLWPHGIEFFPDGFAKSFKYHVERGIAPGPITVFHGNPKPHEVGARWLRENWH